MFKKTLIFCLLPVMLAGGCSTPNDSGWAELEMDEAVMLAGSSAVYTVEAYGKQNDVNAFFSEKVQKKLISSINF